VNAALQKGDCARSGTYQTFIFCQQYGDAGINFADGQRDQHFARLMGCCLFVVRCCVVVAGAQVEDTRSFPFRIPHASLASTRLSLGSFSLDRIGADTARMQHLKGFCEANAKLGVHIRYRMIYGH
jgi:hypothetical protein